MSLKTHAKKALKKKSLKITGNILLFFFIGGLHVITLAGFFEAFILVAGIPMVPQFSFVPQFLWGIVLLPVVVWIHVLLFKFDKTPAYILG